MSSSAVPETVKIYPLTGLKSLRETEAGGAWRLFVLAKNMAGVSDHIGRETLKQALLSFGVQEYNFRRWLDAGRRNNLFTDVQRKSGEWMLILPSWKNAAKEFETNLDRPVIIETKLLFSKGWRAHLFAFWQASYTNNGERLVSQRKQAEVTGIDPQTQRQFNEEAGVKSTRNFAISNIHANGYSGVLEFGNRACLFEYWDNEKHQKYLGWRLPNSRVYPNLGINISNKTPRNLSLFNKSADQYTATMKTLRKLDTEEKQIKTREIYIFRNVSSKGNNLWTHAPIQ
jgi:hypothetical protein